MEKVEYFEQFMKPATKYQVIFFTRLSPMRLESYPYASHIGWAEICHHKKGCILVTDRVGRSGIELSSHFMLILPGDGERVGHACGYEDSLPEL